MGVVYKARDERLNRLVALKVIRSGESASREERDRLRAEAEAAARVQHPHVVQVYTSGEFGDCPYFVCEYVEGGSLLQRVAGRPQAPADAARLLLLLARAVQAAHHKGIIHRDLKPANVLLAPPADEPALNTAYGVPKVGDFGLAKYLDRARGGGTASGAVVGTVNYMAPEQAAGEGHRVGPATDVYALGVILYELLAGQVPIRGKSDFDTLLKIVSEPVRPPRLLRGDVPPELETICLRCLHKEPERRYPTAQALAEDLARFLQAEPVAEAPTVPVLPRPHRGRVGLVLAAAVAVVVLAALGVWGLSVGWRWLGARTERSEDTGREQLPPLKGYVDVKVRQKLESPPDQFLWEPGVLPLRTGYFMRIEAELNRPAFLYVVWLESSGRAVPKYPWQKDKWDRQPAEEKPLITWAFPRVKKDDWAPLDPSPPGIEAILLLVRENVLPAGEDAALARLFEGLPKQARLEDRQVRVWLENGEVVEDRGAANEAKAAEARDLLSRLQALLRGPLRERFSYTRAVCYSFAGR
jgi:hypothetical protein